MFKVIETFSGIGSQAKALERIGSRKEKQIWNQPVVQRYADDVFYAFTRGDVLVALTRGEGCQRTITYHEFKSGDRLCNALDPNDCVTVE